VRPDDVVTAVRFAGEHGMPIAVQAAGHGARIPADGALLVDTSAVRAIEIDAATNLARMGAGARLLDVVLAAEPHGLAIPAGYARTWVLSATRSGAVMGGSRASTGSPASRFARSTS
jgi:FAD/FMN-containing dehydrogenase